jgi:hypothetical protein
MWARTSARRRSRSALSMVMRSHVSHGHTYGNDAGRQLLSASAAALSAFTAAGTPA